ncbi:MAG: twin-arginine translocase TatA/TatE family subunit [Thermodesulfobacteriota bacterium]
MIGPTELIVIAIILGIIFGPGRLGSNLARMKGRSRQAWFVACALMPLAAVLLTMLPPRSVAQGLVTECPWCRQYVTNDEWVCRHCGKKLL